MTKVDYLSSAGLRLLLLIYREFAAREGKLVLVGVSDGDPDCHVAYRVPQLLHARRDSRPEALQCVCLRQMR